MGDLSRTDLEGLATWFLASSAGAGKSGFDPLTGMFADRITDALLSSFLRQHLATASDEEAFMT